MERIADIISVATLGILCWQDFRSRRIAWWLLPILAVTFFLASLHINSASEIGMGFSLNITFLLIQFLFVWIWFSLKQRKFSKLIDSQIGLGDLLFMICIAFAFSPANFMIFYTIGMILTLVVAMGVRLFRSTSKAEIPLAGALAIPLLVLCSVRIIIPTTNFYSDEWLVRIFETGL